jgi:hypothetical protein
MASALFGEPMPMGYDPFPPMVEEVAAPVERMPQRAVRQQRRGRPANSIADAISGFLNN